MRMRSSSATWAIIAGLAFILVYEVQQGGAAGLVGDCSNCHTMHNSEQGKPVARVGTDGTVSSTPVRNLLKFDCVACHAQDPSGGENVAAIGDSVVPQVMHSDTVDLAGGNFRYIADSGNRKGHNIVDVVGAETDLAFPPGHKHKDDKAGEGKFDVSSFTCAGSMGCHGYRGQALKTTELSCDPVTGEKYINGEPTGEQCTSEDYENEGTITKFRTGIAALSGYDGYPDASLKRGAHHKNYDGYKKDGSHPNYYDSPLSHSYRFILALRGYGNEVDRWQNVDETSHNEYAAGYPDNGQGDALRSTDYSTTDKCQRCHFVPSTFGIGGTESRLYTPGATMTGFCVTCHGKFHSSGETNGTSGAFLRHPSDYVIPDKGEYSAYTSYDVTAPVGRPKDYFTDDMTPDKTVTPGRDVVMCLSCHLPHASEYDYMLRFNYSEMTSMTAGAYDDSATATKVGGCLACHTVKGVNPDNR